MRGTSWLKGPELANVSSTPKGVLILLAYQPWGKRVWRAIVQLDREGFHISDLETPENTSDSEAEVLQSQSAKLVELGTSEVELERRLKDCTSNLGWRFCGIRVNGEPDVLAQRVALRRGLVQMIEIDYGRQRGARSSCIELVRTLQAAGADAVQREIDGQMLWTIDVTDGSKVAVIYNQALDTCTMKQMSPTAIQAALLKASAQGFQE